MPALQIVRQKQINVPPEHMYDILSDLSQWPSWSPWLIAEPEATVTVHPTGKSYSWQGARVGEGHMKITSEENPHRIALELVFVKPWKSTATVSMDIEPTATGSMVTWSMASRLPFFMFFMKKMMTAFIGNDYERGLNLLKDYAEDGEVHSKLGFTGRSAYPGCNYVGIKRSCTMGDMPTLMEADFTALITESMQHRNCRPQDAICIYHKWDMVRGTMSYTAGIPYDGDMPTIPSAQLSDSIPPTDVYTMTHTGPYHHLGNAWSTLYGMVRSKEIKARRGLHPFETYGNSPKDTMPRDLVTYVHFPVR